MTFLCDDFIDFVSPFIGVEAPSRSNERKAVLARLLCDGDQKAKLLGAKLTACRDDKRCGSAFCPSCLRYAQACFTYESCPMITGFTRARVSSFSAIVGNYPEGGLHQANLLQIMEKLQRRHRQAKVVPLAGC